MTDLVTTRSGGQLEAQMTYAKALAASDLLPAAYRGKPANVLVALALGDALGLPATAALYGINVIQGKPTLSAETMRAVVLAHGHRFDVEAFTETEARVACARAERPGDVSTFTFTLEDAKRAGLLGGNYDKYPKAMLLARATSQACRAVFPDVLAGVSYTPDELAEPVAEHYQREQLVAPVEDEWTARPASPDAMGRADGHRPAYPPRAGRDYTPEGAIDGTVDVVTGELVVEHTEAELVEALDQLEAVEAPLERKLTGPARRQRAHDLAGPATSAQLGKLRALMREQKVDAYTLDRFARESLGFESANLEQLTRGQASRLIDSLEGSPA